MKYRDWCYVVSWGEFVVCSIFKGDSGLVWSIGISCGVLILMLNELFECLLCGLISKGTLLMRRLDGETEFGIYKLTIRLGEMKECSEDKGMD